MKDSINFLLAGVGGQGTILASDVLVNVGMRAGYQTKQAEVHGMSQRGGSVTSFVRWGKVVYSPIVGAGEVDVFLSFEKAETLRNLGQLRAGALIVVNMQAIEPVTVTAGGQAYPEDERLRKAVSEVTDKAIFVDGERIATELGNSRAANVVLIGVLSALIEHESLAPSLTPDDWLAIIAERVPAKYLELNKKAFQVGRETVLEPAR